MDEVRLWRVARTQKQILEHMRDATGLENHQASCFPLRAARGGPAIEMVHACSQRADLSLGNSLAVRHCRSAEGLSPLLLRCVAPSLPSRASHLHASRTWPRTGASTTPKKTACTGRRWWRGTAAAAATTSASSRCRRRAGRPSKKWAALGEAGLVGAAGAGASLLLKVHSVPGLAWRREGLPAAAAPAQGNDRLETGALSFKNNFASNPAFAGMPDR